MAETISKAQHILQVLANILETRTDEKITTKLIAEEVGVTEAALYRHFPSKSRMYMELIDFIETSIFTLIRRISEEEESAVDKIEKILMVILTFAEKNPGLSRMMTGEVLYMEKDARLIERINDFSSRIEAQLRNILRESQLENTTINASANAIAIMLVATCHGLIYKFTQTNFKALPTENWNEQWQILKASIFAK